MRILERIICWILGHKYQSLDGSPFWIECISCGKWERLIIKHVDPPECKTYEAIERCNKTIWSDSDAMYQDKNTGKMNIEKFKEKIEPLYRSYLCNICKEPAPMGMWVWGNPRCKKHLHSIDDQNVTVTREKS